MQLIVLAEQAVQVSGKHLAASARWERWIHRTSGVFLKTELSVKLAMFSLRTSPIKSEGTSSCAHVLSHETYPKGSKYPESSWRLVPNFNPYLFNILNALSSGRSNKWMVIFPSYSLSAYPTHQWLGTIMGCAPISNWRQGLMEYFVVHRGCSK